MDDKINKSIKEELDKEMSESALDINVDTRDGFVTLSGIVDTLSEKNAAEEITTKIEGIKGIENNITVATDGYITDKDTEAAVIKQLQHNKRLTGVSANVKKGLAVLGGSVETLRDKRRAASEAEKVMGIKDVVSNIKITSANRFDDNSIANKVTQRFSQTDLSIPDIFTDVKEGIVRLSGHVDSRKDMEMAVEIVEEVEGVKKVINSLKLR